MHRVGEKRKVSHLDDTWGNLRTPGSVRIVCVCVCWSFTVHNGWYSDLEWEAIVNGERMCFIWCTIFQPPQKRWCAASRNEDNAPTSSRQGFWSGLLQLITKKFRKIFLPEQHPSESCPGVSTSLTDSDCYDSVTMSQSDALISDGQQSGINQVTSSTPCTNDPPFQIPSTSSLGSPSKAQGLSRIN